MRSARRMRVLAAAAGVGVLAAVILPNTLEWRSDSPYLDTVTGVVNYREGAGAGVSCSTGTRCGWWRRIRG